MANNALFATVAALSGDPARAVMLQALMDGRALTAGEPALIAGITAQTASGHLNRMTATGLLSIEKQGRHRYHRLATPSVAHMLESIMQVASELAPIGRKLSICPKDAALRRANLLRPFGRFREGFGAELVQVWLVQCRLSRRGGPAEYARNHVERRVRLRSA